MATVTALPTTPTTSTTTPTTNTSSSVIPDSLRQAALQAAKIITPVFSGSHIDSIPKVASAIGANYQYNSATNTHTVNGNPIQPTSVVNGEPHGPTAQIAHLAGYPSSAIQTSATGVQIMPHPSTPTATPAQQSQYQQDVNTYGQYWANVLQNGAVRDPKAAGETLQQSIQHEAQMYGIPTSAVQVKNNMTYVAPQYVRAYLDNQAAQAKAQQAQQQAQMAAQMQQQQTQMLSQQAAPMDMSQLGLPQAPQLQQIPTFDMSQIQPFQFNAQQDFQNVYSQLDPTYQQTIQQEDQKINDAMNKRGLYNSGIAQQAVNQSDQALLQKEYDAINKQVQADYNNQLKAYQNYMSNLLNAYKANTTALHDNGALANQQFSYANTDWGKLLPYMSPTAAQMLPYQYPSANSLVPYMYGPTPAQMLPYQYPSANTMVPYIYGPTPYQQQTLDLNQLKTILPYQQMTAYQQATIGLDQQKLQAQIAQNAVSDQQKWAQIMGVGPNGQPTLDAQKLQEQIAKDTAAANVAAENASNNQARTQITALHDQLVAAGQIITNLTNQGVKATDPQMQQAIQNYNNINAAIQVVENSLGGSSSSTPTPYVPGVPLLQPN